MFPIKNFKLFFMGLLPLVLSICDRTPEKVNSQKNIDIYRYVIEISGNPIKYVPEEQYTLSLKVGPNALRNHMYRDFTLSVESIQFESGYNEVLPNTGQLQLVDNMLTKFSFKCPNTIMQTSSVPKGKIEVTWIAPPTGSGCVAIRATVVESKEEWFSEDGSLTRILCEDVEDNGDTPPPVLKHCRACDEAKYEMAFEGLWTRNTHPNDYPSDIWSTRFSDIVGASHAYGNAFWNYAELASDNLKMLAENGNTSGVETQLKEGLGKTIRTIIRANGLSYPDITSKTFTVFRVDKKNHLVSLASKIVPSPDWIVGVSNLELCQRNGTWAESRVLNLYPWDIGTDDGPSYNSRKQPSLRNNPIKKITASSPNDPRSPFYNEEGEELKPLARLYLTRQKIYEKECSGSEEHQSDSSEDDNPECATTKWSSYSSCSAECGPGFKKKHRLFINPEIATNCKKRLVDKRKCYGLSANCESVNKLDENDPKCELEDYGEWSSCSNKCGKGTKTHDRKFKYPEDATLCSNNEPEKLQENEECTGEGENCENVEQEEEVECPGTKWDIWSPCTVTCGTGNKKRFRVSVVDDENNSDDTEISCSKTMEEVECYEKPCENGETGEQPPQEGDEESPSFGDHLNADNQIGTTIFSEPLGPVVNCKVTKWSLWSQCGINSNKKCGKGFKTRTRQIVKHPVNGGRSCPKKLVKKKRCVIPCNNEAPPSENDPKRDPTQATWGPGLNYTPKNRIDCKVSGWSAWSPCSSNCGGMAIQQRTRSIVQPPNKDGTPCPSRIETRRCPLPLACTDKGFSIL